MLEVSEVLEALEMPEVIRCALLCTLDVVKGKLRLLEVLLEVLEMPEVIRCARLCLPEIVC